MGGDGGDGGGGNGGGGGGGGGKQSLRYGYWASLPRRAGECDEGDPVIFVCLSAIPLSLVGDPSFNMLEITIHPGRVDGVSSDQRFLQGGSLLRAFAPSERRPPLAIINSAKGEFGGYA